jgi:hypothetical protein
MIRIRVILLALMAILAMSAVAAAAAMANEGTFVNSKGEALAKKVFTGTSGETKLESGFGTVVCKKDTAHGVILNKEEGEETVLFKECESSLLGKCTGGEDAEGKAPAGSIYILVGTHTRRATQSSTEVLLQILVLKTKTKEEGVFDFECGGVKIETRGSFLVKSNSTNTLKKVWTFTAEANSKKENTPTEYENEKKEKVKVGLESNELFGFEKSTQVGAEEVTFEEEGKFV